MEQCIGLKKLIEEKAVDSAITVSTSNVIIGGAANAGFIVYPNCPACGKPTHNGSPACDEPVGA